MTNSEIYKEFAKDKDKNFLQEFFSCSLAGIRKWEGLNSKIPDRVIRAINQELENNDLRKQILVTSLRNQELEDHLKKYFDSEIELTDELKNIEKLKEKLCSVSNGINSVLDRLSIYKKETKNNRIV